MRCCGKNEIEGEADEGPPTSNNLLYGLDEVPAWYTCLKLGLQHCLTTLGSSIAVSFTISEALCLQNNALVTSELISTIFFVSGIATLMQTMFGIRLPIVQGAAFSFVIPALAILSSPRWKCYPGNATENDTDSWQPAMREIQGSLMVASAVQFLIGATGIIGFLMNYIGPLTVAPTVTLIGLSLFGFATDKFAGKHWGIAAMSIGLIIIFSQNLQNVAFPFPYYTRKKGFRPIWMKIFRLFPILLAISVVWLFCYILTVTEVFPSDPNVYGYAARTDVKAVVLNEAPWFRIPYPGQWGTPTVSVSGALGMISGVLASIIDSFGNYFACARLCNAPAPPKHAINRGILIEGIGSVVAGAWGTGSGTTNSSENIGALGVTKVGSRRVVETCACLMMLFGIIGKFGALFTTIPYPIIGGMLCVMLGMIAAVGISNLQYVDLNSSRNLLIIGFATFMGLAVPEWVKQNTELISTGAPELDQTFLVLLRTDMFLAGFFGFILDNTIPGTKAERGILAWKKHEGIETGDLISRFEEVDYAHVQNTGKTTISAYDFPFDKRFCCANQRCISFMRYMPICPMYGNQEISEELEVVVNSTTFDGTTELDETPIVCHNNTRL